MLEHLVTPGLEAGWGVCPAGFCFIRPKGYPNVDAPCRVATPVRTGFMIGSKSRIAPIRNIPPSGQRLPGLV